MSDHATPRIQHHDRCLVHQATAHVRGLDVSRDVTFERLTARTTPLPPDEVSTFSESRLEDTLKSTEFVEKAELAFADSERWIRNGSASGAEAFIHLGLAYMNAANVLANNPAIAPATGRKAD